MCFSTVSLLKKGKNEKIFLFFSAQHIGISEKIRLVLWRDSSQVMRKCWGSSGTEHVTRCNLSRSLSSGNTEQLLNFTIRFGRATCSSWFKKHFIFPPQWGCFIRLQRPPVPAHALPHFDAARPSEALILCCFLPGWKSWNVPVHSRDTIFTIMHLCMYFCRFISVKRKGHSRHRHSQWLTPITSRSLWEPEANCSVCFKASGPQGDQKNLFAQIHFYPILIWSKLKSLLQ